MEGIRRWNATFIAKSFEKKEHHAQHMKCWSNQNDKFVIRVVRCFSFSVIHLLYLMLSYMYGCSMFLSWFHFCAFFVYFKFNFYADDGKDNRLSQQHQKKIIFCSIFAECATQNKLKSVVEKLQMCFCSIVSVFLFWLFFYAISYVPRTRQRQFYVWKNSF